MKKSKSFALKMLLLLISVGIVISSLNVASILEDYNKSTAVYDGIVSSAVSMVKGKKEEAESLSINFDALHKINSDIVGWLYCDGTAINYPVALGKDNEYYLHHLPNGNTSSSGTIFMDCRNTVNDNHIFIYGHHMKNGSMFASLNNYASQSYYEQHPTFLFYLGEQKYTLRVYSAYYTDSGDYTYSISADTAEYARYAKRRSCISTNAKYDPQNDGIVTLSTCAYLRGYDRFVVQCISERSN